MTRARSELSLALCFPQFRYDLRPATLGTLLLRDSIVCARQTSCGAVLAWPCAITYAFNLSLMTAIASSLDSGRGTSRVGHNKRHASLTAGERTPV